MTISDILILTGAGFTRNFGGYLSNEMWATIFSSPLIQDRPVLRSLLLKDLNFENVYSRVIESGEFPPEEEPILREAICGYFPYKLKDIFYEDTDTVPWREIRTAIHGS